MKRVPNSLELPVALDPRKRDPLHRQLYDWFQNAIVSGQLRPRQRVPSTRTLAAELNISRIPVLQAFDQLKAEGYLEALVGAGTRVSSSIPQETLGRSTGILSPPGQKKGRRKMSPAGTATKASAREPWLDITGAFRPHLPALDHFPIEVWSRLVARHARRRTKDLMAYGDQMGHAPFREAVAQYLRAVRGVRCDAAQVMVTSGSQQALHLCARVLLDPGEPVWIEEPGYPGAHQAFAAAGSRMIPVPVDAEGLDVQEGTRLGRNARAVYVTPSHQYPLGATMSVARRIQLLNWAARSGAWVIEDDYDSEYRQGIRPIASLQGLDSDARVLYVGTFSKALFPALRVGYVVVPGDLIGAFSDARDAADIFPSTLYQAVLADFIQEGHFVRHVRRMRVLYTDRCNALVAALRAQTAGVLQIVNGEAGMHLVGLLPPGLKDTAISREAAKRGVSAMPLSHCCLQRPVRQGLVLGYGAADEAQIQQGARRLKLTLEGALGVEAFRESAERRKS
jgi:GntR family transcriptional regulator/MocR family aminotransferase